MALIFHWYLVLGCFCYSTDAVFLFLQEEMEEDAQTTIYDNFKFLTKEDLEKLNLTSLIGTNLLRASMHGFFIDYKLYKKVNMVTYMLFLCYMWNIVLGKLIVKCISDWQTLYIERWITVWVPKQRNTRKHKH